MIGDTEGWKNPPQTIVAPICETLKNAALALFVQLLDGRSTRRACLGSACRYERDGDDRDREGGYEDDEA